jgi:iron-sulfur cluster insertion protein
MITLTENAIGKLKDLFAEENNPNLKLRTFVQGGGCSGMQYGFTFDEDQNEDDFDFNFDGVPVVVDSMSAQYLQGAKIDYKEDLMGASFSIDNPNAETTCGCGSSFNPK